MKNKISQKLIASLLVLTFAVSNSALSVLALDEKPELRTGNDDNVVKLKADIAVTDIDETITLSLRDSDVKQVLRMFADKAGLNIIFDKDVSGEVTLDLVDVPLSSAFDMVLGIAQLNYVVDNKTLIVSSAGSDMAAAKQEITIVPVKYIDAAAMADFLNKNIFSMKKPGLSGTEIVTTNPMTNELLVFGTKNDVAIARKIVEKFDKKPLTTSVKVSHTTPSQMADLICNMLLPATSSTGGGGGGGGSTGGAANISGGVMTGAASEVELGGGEVACTISSSPSGTYSSLPFQSLIVSFFTQQGTIGVIGGSEAQLEMIKEFIEANDKKQPQAYLEISIIELSESGSKALQNTWQYISKNFSFNFSEGNSSIGSPFPIFFKGNEFDSYKDLTSEPTKVGQYPGKTALTYTMNYLLENGKGRVVANPRVLITNGQESTIDLTSDYVQTVTSQVVETAISPVVQRTYNMANDNGIKVSITPFISPDGYVTLNIKPDYATIKEQYYTANAETGEDDLGATALQRRNMDLKNVRIKDGETLVIAGMIKEEETKSVQKIPFLGDIPGIGALFRSSSTKKTKEEMVIMITPKIIVDSDDVKADNTL